MSELRLAGFGATVWANQAGTGTFVHLDSNAQHQLTVDREAHHRPPPPHPVILWTQTPDRRTGGTLGRFAWLALAAVIGIGSWTLHETRTDQGEPGGTGSDKQVTMIGRTASEPVRLDQPPATGTANRAR